MIEKKSYNAGVLENITQKGAGNEGEYNRVAEIRKKLKETQTKSSKNELLQKLQTLERQIQSNCGRSNRKTRAENQYEGHHQTFKLSKYRWCVVCRTWRLMAKSWNTWLYISSML